MITRNQGSLVGSVMLDHTVEVEHRKWKAEEYGELFSLVRLQFLLLQKTEGNCRVVGSRCPSYSRNCQPDLAAG